MSMRSTVPASPPSLGGSGSPSGVTTPASVATALPPSRAAGAGGGGMRSSLFTGVRGGTAAAVSSSSASSQHHANGNDASSASNNRNMMKQMDEEGASRENDAIMDALAGDMRRLRGEAAFLRGEVAEQNQLLNNIQGFMLGARDGVIGTVGKLDATMRRFGIKHTIYFALVLTAVAFIVWYLFKYMVLQRSSSSPSEAVVASPDAAR